jgi:hypothetical protein
MSRVIRITECRQCPSCDHKGGFGKIAYIPVCRATGKELPYTVGLGYGTMLVATQTPGDYLHHSGE